MSSQIENLIIYHTNDMHDGGEALDRILKIKKNQSTLILDSGDALAGSNTVFKISEKILQKMNRAKYDAMAMGNREFNYLRYVLEKRANEAEFPILCANLEDLKGYADKFYSRYEIREAGRFKVGIFGLTPVQYDDESPWLVIMKFRFLDPIKTAGKVVEEIKEKVNLVIALSHLGIEKDRELAAKVDGIDLILGGHSHTPLKEPELINDTYIFQGEPHGKSFGRIEITPPDNPNKNIGNLKYEFVNC